MRGPSFQIDLRDRTMTVHLADDEVVELEVPDDVFRFDTNVERLALDIEKGVLEVGLPGGTTALAELSSGPHSVTELRARRPIVYLDQNHWSSLTAWFHGEHDLPSGDAAAAAKLVDLVGRRELLLPASSAHFVETTPMFGQPRVALASTILVLSRGWQMRNPLHVRIEELTLGLRGEGAAARDVFSPGADEIFASSVRTPNSDALPAPFAEVASEMTAILSIYDTIVDPVSIEDEGGIAAGAADRWARAQAEIAQQLHADGASRELTWRVVHGRLLADLADDLRQAGSSAGLNLDDTIARLGPPTGPLGSMPFLARLRHLLFSRIRNVGQRWERNDLVDSIYLTCAAGYADVVIGERSAIGYMRQGRDLPPGGKLASTLAEGAELLGI